MSPVLPDNHAVATAMLKLLHLRPKGMAPSDVYPQLAEMLGVDHAVQSLRRGTTLESQWHNRCQTARQHLVRKGEMYRQPRGRWALTPKGVDAAMGRPVVVPVQYLPSCLDWL